MTHHPKCYQSVGVPFDLPVNLCDCRTLWMLDTAVAEDKLARLAALFDAACPDWREPIHLSVELDSADIRKAYGTTWLLVPHYPGPEGCVEDDGMVRMQERGFGGETDGPEDREDGAGNG